MAFPKIDTWIWHPNWKEGTITSSAGGIVHFRRTIDVETLPSAPIHVDITADTKYKFYINSHLVASGPVKGDEHLWFYDQVNVQPFLQVGLNHFHIRVLRLDFATPFATSFPRLPQAGLLIRSNDLKDLRTSNEWDTAIDLTTRLLTNTAEDAFLHIYEEVDNRRLAETSWVPAKELEFSVSHGISAPWKLAKRMIPVSKLEPTKFKEIHNIRSIVARSHWEDALLGSGSKGLCLPAGTTHHVELEAENHMTASLDFIFSRPLAAESILKVTYSECYEDEPESVPWIRRKGDRRDLSKRLLGPEDVYMFGGKSAQLVAPVYESADQNEIFTPFHFRTLRFIAVDINVGKNCDLHFQGINLTTTNYPLTILASFHTPDNTNQTLELWQTSISTLRNCMHDCYEDCPFYEQLQYAMDVRSSALFTYRLSNDDRLARQAITQLHNSYQPSTGLTASRAPAHQHQIIPHFSLFWIFMLTDHFSYFQDSSFVRPFLSACDGVLESFARRIDSETNLVRSLDAATSASQWDFVDWTPEWKPFGIPPAGERTGYLSYTNMLYAYSLKRAAHLLTALNRPALASEYISRADSVVKALRKHCFNGKHFTDGRCSSPKSNSNQDLSQLSQVWAVLCGASPPGPEAQTLLRTSLSSPNFTKTSTAMSFYTLRALSLAGGTLYNESFHAFWEPWRAQLKEGVTTWVEDQVSLRSDCHAWGSSPIYEFLAEVAGVRDDSHSEGNESVLVFEPRVELFPELKADVPFVLGGDKGIAFVGWTGEGGRCKVELELKFEVERAEGRSAVYVKVFGVNQLYVGKIEVFVG